MTTGRDHFTRAETVTIAAIENGVPALGETREIIAEFLSLARRESRLTDLLLAATTNEVSQMQEHSAWLNPPDFDRHQLLSPAGAVNEGERTLLREHAPFGRS